MSPSRSKQTSTQQAPTEHDIGAAMMAWYAEAIQQYPGGLVTQAQAATMLGINRMALSRLVARGYLRAVYFPKPPDVVGMSIGQDDPTWLKILGWLGLAVGDDQFYAFPKACYVAFADVLDLWERGDTKRKCARDWNELMAVALPRTRRGTAKSAAKLREIHREKQRIAALERENEQRK